MSDRFEHKLREKAANFEVPFNEADWDKMNLMLEADSGKKSVSWLRRLLLLSLVANFAFLTWFGYSKLTETDQPRLAQNAEVNSQHTSTSKSNSSISKSTDLNSTSSNSSQSNFNKDSKPSELNSTSDDRSKSKTNPSLANKPNVSLKGSSLINHLRARKSASDFAEKNTSSYKNNRSRDKRNEDFTANPLTRNEFKAASLGANALDHTIGSKKESNITIRHQNTSLHPLFSLANLPFKTVGLNMSQHAQTEPQDQKITKRPVKKSNGWFLETGVGSLKSSVLATGNAWFITAGKGFFLTPGFDMYLGIQFSSQHSTRIFSQNPPATTLLAASYDPNLPNFGIFQQVSTHNQRIGIQSFFERSRSYNPGYFKPFLGVSLNYLTASKIEALQYSASHELEYSNVADFNRELKGTVKSNVNPISMAERFNVSLTGGFAKEWEMKKIMEKFRLSTYVIYTPTNKKSPVNIPFQLGMSAGFRW